MRTFLSNLMLIHGGTIQLLQTSAAVWTVVGAGALIGVVVTGSKRKVSVNFSDSAR